MQFSTGRNEPEKFPIQEMNGTLKLNYVVWCVLFPPNGGAIGICKDSLLSNLLIIHSVHKGRSHFYPTQFHLVTRYSYMEVGTHTKLTVSNT